MTPSESSLHRKLAQQRKLDWAFVNTSRFFAFLVLISLTGILISLFIGAMPAMDHFGWKFLTSSQWNPVTNEYGALAPIYGTLMTSFIALILAVPISFGIAVFLTELCPNWLKKPIGIAVELLAGVPSIIYGMWGLFMFAPWFAKNVQPWLIKTFDGVPVLQNIFGGMPMGIGVLTAGIILAVMIIPYIASVMRDVFEVVPTLLKESAYGLGATTWEVVSKVVLPYTKVGVVGGIILGLGRALGETMAVTFVIGNIYNISPKLFNPGVSITSSLANEFAEASNELHMASLLYLGFILFFITFVVLCISKLLLMRVENREGR